MERFGIFGGTFDPPHLGHLILAAEARAQLGLDRLLWVLTPDPPHKQGQAIAALPHRLEMVRLAIVDDPLFEVSNVELDRPGPHYALDTMQILARQYPGAKLVYLMGGDSLRDLPTWHRPDEFLSACDLIGVMRRPGDAIDLAALEERLPGLRVKVRFVESPLLDISAHEVRRRIAEGRPFRYFLPVGVYKYICKEGLYRRPSS
ncbi:MAG TPA: nicotinate-nucleotide adenylyltransferase [Anaerolineales bacterium]|nr:nicotinate-nucleotide adenylyltransferase [Anaerolineales bacterium]